MFFIGFNRKDSESSRSSTQIAWLSTTLETVCQFGTNRLKEGTVLRHHRTIYVFIERSRGIRNVIRVAYVLVDAFSRLCQTSLGRTDCVKAAAIM